MSKRRFRATFDDSPTRKGQNSRRLDGPGSVPVRMEKVKGVGRYAGRGYCVHCGHTKGRCIC